jgi:hypothetical protein
VPRAGHHAAGKLAFAQRPPRCRHVLWTA